jgi:excisionase family DNA binding protein
MQYMTYKSLAELLNVPVDTLYCWVARQEIPHTRVGARVVRFRRDEIERWLEAKSVAPQHANRRVVAAPSAKGGAR